MDCDTCIIIQEILCDEIEDEEFLEFALDNIDELLSDIAKGNLNIRTHRDIIGGCGLLWGHLNFKGGTNNGGRSPRFRNRVFVHIHFHKLYALL